jgi:transcription termination factor Rho
MDSVQMKISEMEVATLAELRQIAEGMSIPNAKGLKKENLILNVRRAEAEQEGSEVRGGVLEITPEGVGFLRTNYSIGPDDVYVSQAQLRRYDLRMGDFVMGVVRPPRDAERHYGLLKVETINMMAPEEIANRPNFENLVPIFPDKRFDLETDRSILSSRLINLIAPIGRGQRGMIVSPPKAGKTTILKQLANSISSNNPDVHLIIGLIGERPEEVTDMDRSVDAEVVASTFDEPVTSHVRTAEITLERAKRLVEIGRDVVILMDSLTRLARAYNLVVNPSGRTLSGGMDPSALYPPKKFFGAARNIEGGGSLTIIATRWSIPVQDLTMLSTRNLRAQAIWSFISPAACRNAASSPLSTSNVPPLAAKSCCSARYFAACLVDAPDVFADDRYSASGCRHGSIRSH